MIHEVCECGSTFERWNNELQLYVCARCGTILDEQLDNEDFIGFSEALKPLWGETVDIDYSELGMDYRLDEGEDDYEEDAR